MRTEFLHLDESARESGFGFSWTAGGPERLKALLAELRLAGVQTIAISDPAPALRARFEAACATVRETGLEVWRFSRQRRQNTNILELRAEDRSEMEAVALVDRDAVHARRFEVGLSWFSPWVRGAEAELAPERLLRWIFRRENALASRKRFLVYPHPVCEAHEAVLLGAPEIETFGKDAEVGAASFVIPVRPSTRWLECLTRLLRRIPRGAGCEVVIVANSPGRCPSLSTLPGLRSVLESAPIPVRWIGVQAREGAFVAGAARNLGISWARGRVVACIDGDTVPTAAWFRDVLARHSSTGVISMSRRWNVRLRQDGALEKDPESMERYWRAFNERAPELLARPDGWKYMCSHSLAMHRDDWTRVGGFAWPFQSYGYEDTDLAYRASLTGLRFEIAAGESLHFDERPARENAGTRKGLLKKSGEIFLRTHADVAVAHHCHYLFRTSPLWQVSDRLRELLP